MKPNNVECLTLFFNEVYVSTLINYLITFQSRTIIPIPKIRVNCVNAS